MELSPGTRLGHYEIEHVLGAGGMGVVYRAFDALLHRPVAIKFISTSDSTEASRRLLSEARSASALNHPNICTVHDVAEHGDHRFIVMEFIDGRTLGDVVAAGPPPADVALGLAVQIVSALAHAHDRNVAHGDLKAANVLVSAEGRAKVVDFGLAQRYGDGQATETSLTAGTPYAMAPEQLRGSPPDSRSDVWSIGVLLQELTSGTRPFAGDTVPELFAAILSSNPSPSAAHVAPGVRRVIDRCLARDPGRRYQRAGEVLAALEAMSGVTSTRTRPAEDDGTWRIPPQPALTALSASQIVLIGREHEWSLLRAAWERASGGRRQLVLVAGEPGIGKTRLVMEFARSTAPDATVLLGRCDPEALVPHQPFVEALDWYARECPPAVLERQVSEVDGAWELAQLIAPLARRISIAPDAVESNPEGRRYRLFEGMAALVSAIARVRPLVIVLEDLHWADRPTLLLLRHLLRSSHEAALCIVATYRESDADQNKQLGDVLAELRREEGVTRIGLDGLGEHHVSQFIENWTGRASETLTRLVAGNTEGNPFFMSEVLRHLAETGALDRIEAAAGTGAADLGVLPDGVRETIGRRLARLSDGCNRVLGLASVVGREFTLPVLVALADMTEDALLDALDEALGARLIHDAPGGRDRYVFTHALVRDSLYGRLTAARQARLHRQVADALDRLAPPGQRPLADLALHYAHTTSEADAHKAIECALGAAERAAAGFALEEAARFYDIALKALDRLTPDPSLDGRRLDLRFRRGRAFADLGLWAAARTEFEAALPLVAPADSTRRTEVLCELAKCSFWMLDVAAVRRYSAEALELSETIGRDDLSGEAMSWVAGALNAEGDVLGAAEMDRRAAARIGGVKTFGLARTVITLYHLGLKNEALERAHEAVEAARASNDPNFLVFALSHLGIALASGGRYAEAARALEEMRDFGRRHGVLPMLARGIAILGGIHIALGDYERAIALAMEARDLARRVSFPPPVVSAGIDLLTVYARTHDPGRAETLITDVSKAVVAASGWHGWLWRLRFSQVSAELALARGDWPGAIAAATEAIVDGEARPRPKYAALGYTARAQARFRSGDRVQATADADQAVAIARQLGDPALQLKALKGRIEIDGTDALAAEARACVQQILSNLDDESLRRRFLASDMAVVP